MKGWWAFVGLGWKEAAKRTAPIPSQRK